jgi:alpha-L-fucosidase 2
MADGTIVKTSQGPRGVIRESDIHVTYEFTDADGGLHCGNAVFPPAHPPVPGSLEIKFIDYLYEDKDGRLLTGPSVSPELSYRLPDGTPAAICMAPAMDCQILHALFDAFGEAARLLNVDPALRERIAEMKSRVPAPRIGPHGRLLEWQDDWPETDVGHRHISHLFAVFPAGQITPDATPELAHAARLSLERRIEHGGGKSGWSSSWITCCWARLRQANPAHKQLRHILEHWTYPSLLDGHPPGVFQIDGNFGATAAIAEMLLQSHDGCLRLLPALPDAWPDGKVRGLCARGGFEVDIEWAGGRLTSATVRSRLGGCCVVRYAEKTATLETSAGASYRLDGAMTVG